MSASSQQNDKYEWHDVLLEWFEKWLHEYRKTVINAYDIINSKFIPTKQYERATIWCMYVFDVTVLTHQMVSLVHEADGREIESAYYLPMEGVVDVLKRLENQMIQCRNTFDELLTLNAMGRMHTAAASLADTQSSSAASSSDIATPGDLADAAAAAAALPTGLNCYTPDRRYADLMTDVMESVDADSPVVDRQLADLAVTLELLRAGSDRAAVRAENLDQRLPPNSVRAIFMVVAPGDGELARTVVESYLAKLIQTVDEVKTYRIDYGSLLSRWRGESEKNFETLMQWMVDRARQNAISGRGFDALWLDNVHVLMGQRGGGGGGGGGGSEDFLAVIKTTMLQMMDVFNKDKQLSRFALVFSTGGQQADVDSAFRRRMDSVCELPPLSQSPALRNLIVKHALRTVRLNVEGNARVFLDSVNNAGELQNTIYSYYARARFTIGTEFYVAEPGMPGYSLQPLKAYYNLNGNIVRTGNPGCPIMQAVQTTDTATTEADANADGRRRRFYRPGEVDPRNLPENIAETTVYIVTDIEDV